MKFLGQGFQTLEPQHYRHKHTDKHTHMQTHRPVTSRIFGGDCSDEIVDWRSARNQVLQWHVPLTFLKGCMFLHYGHIWAAQR